MGCGNGLAHDASTVRFAEITLFIIFQNKGTAEGYFGILFLKFSLMMGGLLFVSTFLVTAFFLVINMTYLRLRLLC